MPVAALLAAALGCTTRCPSLLQHGLPPLAAAFVHTTCYPTLLQLSHACAAPSPWRGSCSTPG